MPESELNPLAHIAPARKTGAEPLHQDGRPLPWTLLDFWRWSASDLANNALRGQIAEFLVACALGVADGMRVEWASYDLQARDGTTVEVKSAAYLQSWHQQRPSLIAFDIRPTRALEQATNRYEMERRRQADVYVFALLKHQDKATLDPLNLEQWEFYVLATATLDRSMGEQQRISLSSLERLGPIRSRYAGLAEAVRQAQGIHDGDRSSADDRPQSM